MIEVAGGHYGTQRIPALGKSGGRVTFQAVGEVRVNGSVDVRDSNVTLRGPIVTSADFDVSNSEPSNPLRAVHLNGVRGRNLWTQNTRNLVVTGSDFGDYPGGIPVQIGAWPESYDVLFDGVRLHDNPPTDASQHLECIFVVHVQGLIVRNSLFENCSYFNILASECCGGNLPPRDLVLENNVFRQTWRWDNGPKPTAPYSVLLGDNDWGGQVVFRNNLFETPVLFNGSKFVNPAKLSGNVGSHGQCYPGVVYSHNIWDGRTCANTDVRAPKVLDFFDSTWHVQRGSPAIDAGDPGNAPATDREGQLRDGRPDAGPDEFGTPGSGVPPAVGRRDVRAPRLRRLRVRIRRHRAVVLFRLSEPARVALRLDRRRGGRFHTIRRTGWRALTAGERRLRLGKLRAGRYRLRVLARDAAGNRRIAIIRFRVHRR